MKLYHFLFVLALLVLNISYCQDDSTDALYGSYDLFLESVNKKDTLISTTYKTYKCSENLEGTIYFYYKNDTIKLITHSYKQGRYDNWHIERYYLKNNTLRIKTTSTEIIHYNTQSVQSSQRQSFSAQKVLELVEHRMVFDENSVATCKTRSYGEKLSEWDQAYFNTLPFEEADCVEDQDDILYKYRLLRKAEKKLISDRKNPGCIFHLW